MPNAAGAAHKEVCRRKRGTLPVPFQLTQTCFRKAEILAPHLDSGCNCFKLKTSGTRPHAIRLVMLELGCS